MAGTAVAVKSAPAATRPSASFFIIVLLKRTLSSPTEMETQKPLAWFLAFIIAENRVSLVKLMEQMEQLSGVPAHRN
jgi:hypothetical protein